MHYPDNCTNLRTEGKAFTSYAFQDGVATSAPFELGDRCNLPFVEQVQLVSCPRHCYEHILFVCAKHCPSKHVFVREFERRVKREWLAVSWPAHLLGYRKHQPLAKCMDCGYQIARSDLIPSTRQSHADLYYRLGPTESEVYPVSRLFWYPLK